VKRQIAKAARKVARVDDHARYRKKLKENGLGGTSWAAGPWWGNYALSVEPRNGQDRPQMAVLLKCATPATVGR